VGRRRGYRAWIARKGAPLQVRHTIARREPLRQIFRQGRAAGCFSTEVKRNRAKRGEP